MIKINEVTEHENTCKEITEPVCHRVVKHGKVCPECHSKKMQDKHSEKTVERYLGLIKIKLDVTTHYCEDCEYELIEYTVKDTDYSKFVTVMSVLFLLFALLCMVFD